jgi:hydrogenase maturation protease
MTTEANKKPILVLGVGNLIQMDDGVGVHTIQRMAEWDLPEVVELFDGGTAGLDLTGIIEGRQALIVIDAVDAGEKPGTMFRFTPEDIKVKFTHYDSLHQMGLLETLNMAKMQGISPAETVIFGVQPHIVDWGTELTDTVEEKMPRLLELVREELDRMLMNLKQEQQT